MFNPSSHSRNVLIAGIIIFLGVGLAAVSVPKIRMGLRIAWWKATGSLPDIEWTDLARMAKPGAHFNLPDLAETPNPYAAIRNPYKSPEDITEGSELFRSRCANCHGSDGAGGPGGPNLQRRQMQQGSSDWALFRTISFGVRGTAMPASNLPWLDKWRLVAYVRSLTLPTALVSESAVAAARAQPVSYEKIRAANLDLNGWLTYSGSYDGRRFSPDNQITPANAAGLRLLWARQYDTSEPSIETSPLVVGGYMFLTVPPNRVEALDVKTGQLIWAYDRDLPQVSLCCGYVNRGLAILGSTLFLGTLDAHLVALDMYTGQISWDVEIADYKADYSITGAPLALKNLVITGVAGGEFGVRGFIDARDATTGKEVWRFDTIPQSGQPGANTWDGDSARIGGGPTWLTGSFDPNTNLIYWPTGNPSPNFDGAGRAGDNLYTNCVVALDADHGTLRWYFQYSPHDLFDWDATEIPVLIEGNVGGERQELLAQANRNGFFYVLDAKTGAFRFAKPFAKVTWADGIEHDGRPVRVPTAHPSEKGTTIFPGVGGATNWESPSFSPLTGLFYVSALDWGGIFYTHPGVRRLGEQFLGGSFQYLAPESGQGAVRALNPITGEVQWEYRNPATNIGGLLTTAGGVLFGSQDKNFFALDAETGHELWKISTGGRTVAAPITFLYQGRQMVTIAAGHDVLTFGLPRGN
jgi:alcohol dehydrogenase (cytochrome c)